MQRAEWLSLPGMFFNQADRLGQKPVFWTKRDGAWHPESWKEAAAAITDVARGLLALDIQPGDRVLLLSENRPEWAVANLAIMAVGAISVPAYTTSTTEDYRYILANCSAKAAIVSTAALAKRLILAVNQVASVQFMIALEAVSQQSNADIHLWPAMLEMGRSRNDDIRDRVAGIAEDDICCLIHTSGTGGVPKGAMLSHGNILSNCRGAFAVLNHFPNFKPDSEVFLSFLPLSHAYEHTAGLCFPLSIGAELYFSAGVEGLAGEILEVRPTIMTAIPRLYETLQRRILQAIRQKGGRSEKLLHLTHRLGLKRYHDPKSLTLKEKLLDHVCTLLVRRKIRARFGGRLKAFVSGGAPLNTEVGLFFVALGVTLLQGYGQTEASPVISVNIPGKAKIDTVGPPLPEVELRIAEDGEILLRGPSIMKGYWNDAEATRKTIQDGWLHTGDVGELDADGYLKITDRKRDFIKTTAGEMVAPQRIEGFLTLQPAIAQAMVYGDNRAYVVALIVPDAELLRDDAAESPAVHQAISAAIDAANRTLAPVERVRRFLVIGEAFTVENGRMTPTMKIRRGAIKEAYSGALDALYGPQQTA
jgi:long-chain acyl-CoA synthetase